MKLKPWYAHVIVSPDNKDMEIHIQQFSMGVEMKDIDEDILNKLKMLPGFESDGNGIIHSKDIHSSSLRWF